MKEYSFPCCLEWQRLGRPNRTWCPQHKTWRAFCHQSRLYWISIRHNGDPIGPDRDTIVELIESGIGWRVSADPNSWKPGNREDKRQIKALAEWIDAGMPGAAENKEMYADDASRRLSYTRQSVTAAYATVNVPIPLSMISIGS